MSRAHLAEFLLIAAAFGSNPAPPPPRRGTDPDLDPGLASLAGAFGWTPSVPTRNAGDRPYTDPDGSARRAAAAAKRARKAARWRAEERPCVGDPEPEDPELIAWRDELGREEHLLSPLGRALWRAL